MKGTFRLFFESALFVLLFFSSAFLVQHNRIALADNPSISWSQQPLEIQVFPGTGKLLTISFTSNQNLSNADLFIVPELQSYITLSPQNFSNVSANTSNTVRLLITAPSSTALGSYKGTLHLRQDQKTIPETLKISINVVAPSLNVIPNEDLITSPERILDVPGRGSFVQDELLVFFNDDIDQNRVKEIVTTVGGVFISFNPDFNMYQIQIPGAQPSDLDGIIDQLETFPEVKFAMHHRFDKPQAIPNDSEYPEGSWNESSPEGKNWGQEFIKLPSAWEIETGKKEIKIAIIDSGFDENHEDLKDNIARVHNNFFYVDKTHGTSVAGIAAAVGNNQKGITGVPWNTSLILEGATQHDYIFVLDGFKDAIKEKANTINYSAGGELTNSNDQEGVRNFMKEILNYAKEQNSDPLFVFAAGNNCSDATDFFPSALSQEEEFKNNVISVGAVDSEEETLLATYSNYGPSVDVAAPGGGTNLTPFFKCKIFNNKNQIFTTFPDNSYGFSQGTSLAAPFVTGLAGLIYSEGPDQNINLAASGVKKLIIDGAKNGGTFATGPDGHQIPIINAFESLKILQQKEQFLIGSEPGWFANFPATAFGEDDYLTVWEQEKFDQPNNRYIFKIRAARISKSGNLLDDPPLTIFETFERPGLPQVAFGNGKFLIVWNQGEDILMKRIDLQGNILDNAPVQLDESGINGQAPSISYNGSDFVISWMVGCPTPCGIAGVGATIVYSLIAPDLTVKFLRTVYGNGGNLTPNDPKIACAPNLGHCNIYWHDSYKHLTSIVHYNVEEGPPPTYQISLREEGVTCCPALQGAWTGSSYIFIFYVNQDNRTVIKARLLSPQGVFTPSSGSAILIDQDNIYANQMAISQSIGGGKIVFATRETPSPGTQTFNIHSATIDTVNLTASSIELIDEDILPNFVSLDCETESSCMVSWIEALDNLTGAVKGKIIQ